MKLPRKNSKTPTDGSHYLLHSENLARIALMGGWIGRWLQTRTAQMAELTEGLPDPDVTILIRTRNDGEHIRRLFEDIKAQIFDGAVEIIVVDTSSRDDTATYAKSQGAKVISLTQAEFTYPRALNAGFRAAGNPWVVTLVGHSSLTNRLFLKSLTYWAHREKNLAGVYSLPLANWNASGWERLESTGHPSYWKAPHINRELSLGIMGANCSIVKRDAWQQLGGYDERYAGGGEDRALAKTMLDAGATIVREPLCSVYHSHGLNVKNSVRQWIHWSQVGKAASPFKTEQVHKRRPDLR